MKTRLLIVAGALAITVTAAPVPEPITCVPGQITRLVGTGTPRTPLLVFFAGRAVGGGSVNTAGVWSLPLAIGKERPGLYAVEVRPRGSRAVVAAFTCAIGVLAPTAIPAPTPNPLDTDGEDRYNCDDFDTQAQAQRALEAGYTDLDGNDKDGLACESLP